MLGRFESFTLAISEISSSWNKIAEEELRPYGLKGAYVVYLIALFKATDGLTASKLCEMCNKDKAEVSRAVKALESKELLERENITVSSYRAKITLTEKGKNVTKALRKRIKLIVEKGGNGLTDEQRETFYIALGTICENLKKISKEGL